MLADRMRMIACKKGQPLSNLIVGDKIKFGRYQVELEAAQPIIWVVVAKNHSGYPDNSITLHAEKILDLRCVDAKEPNNPTSSRQTGGNNHYPVSNIDQWLNKDLPAGLWYSDQHSYDQAPSSVNFVNGNTPYADHAGFLNLFTVEEKNAILITTLTVNKSHIEGEGTQTITRKIFLPSLAEVGLYNETEEGIIWSYYTDNSKLDAYLTLQAYNNTTSTNKPASIWNPWRWWLRSPNTSYVENVHYVNIDKRALNTKAYNGTYGVRPALNLHSSTLVSNAIDEEGCYILLL